MWIACGRLTKLLKRSEAAFGKIIEGSRRFEWDN
jgi:hypothetical protein